MLVYALMQSIKIIHNIFIQLSTIFKPRQTRYGRKLNYNLTQVFCYDINRDEFIKFLHKFYMQRSPKDFNLSS